MDLDEGFVIIGNAAEGNLAAFEKLVISYEKMVYNICYRYFANEEDAKDTTQEVFIKIFKNLKKYNYKCKFSTWVYKIAVNSCIDQLRKKKSHLRADNEIPEIRDEAKGPAEVLILKESLKNLESAINNMPEKYKTLILLRDINGLSYQEIADITDTNIGTVKSGISRARQYLKNDLINNYGTI